MSEKINVDSLKNKVKGTVSTISTTVKEKASKVDLSQVKNVLKKKDADDSKKSFAETGVLSTKSALKIIYYLMAVDGQITSDEEERFKELGNELDPDFSANYQQITDDCRKQIAKVIDPEDLYVVVKEGVEKAVDSSVATEDSFITPRLLVWDLLTIAHTDDNYEENEKDLIKFIVRILGVYPAVFLEMESTVLALDDIEKEIAWIKSTDRPYLVIEGMVNELEDRKQVLFTSVKNLISM